MKISGSENACRRKREPITDKALRALRPAPRGKRIEVYDTDPKNLVVRVTDAGHISFALLIRPTPGERATRRTLGSYGKTTPDGEFSPSKAADAITLAAARRRAKEWNFKFSGGVDPRDEERAAAEERKAEDRQGIKFGEVADSYLKMKIVGPDPEKPLKRSAGEIARILERYKSIWGSKPVSAITADVIETQMEKKAKDSPYMARNEFAWLRALFNWASKRREYRPLANPCVQIDARELFGAKASRDRFLNDDELRLFWRNVRRLPYPFGVYYRLLTLTGLRQSEVADAEWSEFDFANNLWEIPATRMKGKRPHVIPLTSDTRAILNSITRHANAQFVFSTTAGERPISGFSKVQARLVKRMQRSLKAFARMQHDERCFEISRWSTHDIRRTVRTNLSAISAITHDVREAILAHAKPGVHGVYDRYDHFHEKREALELWAQRLREIVNAPMSDLAKQHDLK